MKQDTRQKIIETGAQIMHRKGYNHTGIQEMLRAAKVPKGSFYFYFNSKEDFGLAVIEYFNTMFQDMIGPILRDTTLSPLQRLENILDYYVPLFTDLEFQCGCPIGNLAQEMGDLSPVFRQKLSDSVDLMIDIYAGLLAEAREAGEIPARLDIRETAAFIVSSWHGALIRMKIVRDTTPLENHKQFILDLLTL